jgi:hypothetical protein
MKKPTVLLTTVVVLVLSQQAPAQATQSWTEIDRQYLLNELIASRDSLARETTNLSPKQWQFEESPDRWSINEVVEHIAIWELLLAREINMSLSAGPRPDLKSSAKPDSVVLGFIMETKPHVSTDYTKPFTFTMPMGLNPLTSNVAWLIKMRNESILFLQVTKEDLRSYYLRPGRSNVHQTYITLAGHTWRHLRQIRRIKQHPEYPGKEDYKKR